MPERFETWLQGWLDSRPGERIGEDIDPIEVARAAYSAHDKFLYELGDKVIAYREALRELFESSSEVTAPQAPSRFTKAWVRAGQVLGYLPHDNK